MNDQDTAARRAGEILGETRATLLSAPAPTLACVGLLAAAGTAYDILYPDSLNNTGLNIAQTVAFYFLNVSYLRNRGMLPEFRARGFWSYVGAGILFTLALLIGFVLLIIPGIILFVRWTPLYGYLLGADRGIRASFSASWAATRPHFWPILLAAMVPMAGFLLGLVCYVLPDLLLDFPSWVLAALANVFIFGSIALSAAVGIAVYGLLEGKTTHYEDVFV